MIGFEISNRHILKYLINMEFLIILNNLFRVLDPFCLIIYKVNYIYLLYNKKCSLKFISKINNKQRERKAYANVKFIILKSSRKNKYFMQRDMKKEKLEIKLR